MENGNEKKNRNLWYWLCRELLACVVLGALLFMAVLVLCWLVIIDGNTTIFEVITETDAELLMYLPIILVLFGPPLVRLIRWGYGLIEPKHSGQLPGHEKKGWSPLTKVLLRALIGLPIGMYTVLICGLAVEAIVETTAGLMSPMLWLFIAAIFIMLWYVIALLRLSFTNKKAAKICIAVGFIVAVILSLVALIFPLCTNFGYF